MNNQVFVGVGAVVVYNNKVLLVKRKYDPCRNCWAIPGGHLEYGETIREAAVRELFEETSIKARPVGIVWVDEILPNKCTDGKHFVLIDVYMEPIDNPPHPAPGSDALDAGFYNLSSPPEPVTKTTLRLLKYIREHNGKPPLLPLGG